MCEPSEEGPHGHEKTTHGDESGSMQLGPKMAHHREKQQVAYLRQKKKKKRAEEREKKKHSENRKQHSGTKKLGDTKERPDRVHKWFGLSQQTDGTHLKAAIYESNVRAGEVKTSLNLSDGALHVGSRQSLGETGEGQRHNK